MPSFLGPFAVAVAIALLARGDALAAGNGKHWLPPAELTDLVTAEGGAPLESDAVRASEAPVTTLDPKAPISASVRTTPGIPVGNLGGAPNFCGAVECTAKTLPSLKARQAKARMRY